VTASASRASRVILLGGTFDPIHNGHLAVADQVRGLLDAQEVWLIPAGVPPHRGATAASAVDREALVRAAAASRPYLRVIDLELRRPGPSYSSTTVAELAAAHPDVEQWFLLGADAAREIRSWHRLGDLLELARFVIVNREGAPELTPADAALLGFDPDRTCVVRVESPPISATEIRRRAAAGERLDGLVPAEVAALIKERGLYGAPGPRP
jgi:nicotinate-nucleotide adenylyltransferase